ncbi:MAG: dockerin type I domain-containing protein [Xenococcaceae cyanobacterium MO_207.B15]|nr:dockerin type I domain-containing protein [Xenococcaceae cyanobacterium MO_207.B15]
MPEEDTNSRIISDVNQDGVVSAFDAYIIYQEANGVDTGFLL